MSKYSLVDYRWVFYSLLGLSFFGPLGLNTFMLVLALIASLLKFNLQRFLGNLKSLPFIVFSGLFFCWGLMSMLWTSDVQEGWKEVISKLPFLLAPVILAGTERLSDHNRRYAFWGFTTGALVSLGICVVLAAVEYFRFPAAYPQPSEAFTYEHLAWHIGIQPIYLSLFVIIAFFFVFFEYIWLNPRPRKRFIFILLALGLFLQMLSSRMEIMVFVLVFSALMLIWMGRTGTIVKPAMIIGLVVGCSIAVILINPVSKERFTEMVDQSEHYSENKYGGRGLRVQKWLNTIESWKDQPLLGTGAGDYWNELAKTYQANGFKVGLSAKFNSHNQYLQTGLTVGIIGVTLLLLVFFSAFLSAFRQKNYHAMAFIAVFVLSCISESMFERQWGIVLFSFYLTFIMVVSPDSKQVLKG